MKNLISYLLHQLIRKHRVRLFEPHPEYPEKGLDYVDQAHVQQEMQFAIDCLPTITDLLKLYPRDYEVSLLDYGPGYAAGSNLYATLFRSSLLWCKVNVDAMEMKSFRKQLVDFDYPLVNYQVKDIATLDPENKWDIIYCSNVIEHLEEPKSLLSHLVNRSKGFVVIYAPYDETELMPGHLSTITEELFRDFTPKSVEIRTSLGWEGRQILVVLPGKAK